MCNHSRSAIGDRAPFLPPLPAKPSASLIYRVASFLQSGFPGKIHCRELFIPVMNRYGSFRVLYECVIALPIPVRELMKLHFDLYAFVDRLNHRYAPSSNRKTDTFIRASCRPPENVCDRRCAGGLMRHADPLHHWYGPFVGRIGSGIHPLKFC